MLAKLRVRRAVSRLFSLLQNAIDPICQELAGRICTLEPLECRQMLDAGYQYS